MCRERILDIQPHDIHQRTAFVVGSRVEMEEFARYSEPLCDSL